MRLLARTDPPHSQHKETKLRFAVPPKGFVLLLEDNDDDAFFLKRAWKARQRAEDILWVENGQDAKLLLASLTNAAESPCLIITDLKMPQCDGFEFLRWLRDQPKLGATRCVVLSSSDEPRDIAEAKALGADGFFTKPSNLNTYAGVLDHIAALLGPDRLLANPRQEQLHMSVCNEWMGTGRSSEIL